MAAVIQRISKWGCSAMLSRDSQALETPNPSEFSNILTGLQTQMRREWRSSIP